MSYADDDDEDCNDDNDGDNGGDHNIRSVCLVLGGAFLEARRLCAVHFAGHINFNDEVTAGLRLADGVLLCVDVVEGVMLVTDKVLKQAAAEGLPICLVLTKVSIHHSHSTHPTMALTRPGVTAMAQLLHNLHRSCGDEGLRGRRSRRPNSASSFKVFFVVAQ